MVNFQDRFFNMIDTNGNKKRMIILPQKLCEDTFKKQKRLDRPAALISITCKEELPAKIQKIKNLAIFRMRFDDITNPNDSFAPRHQDFKGLRNFIEQEKDDFCIVVHCGAGLSRSAAVAWAICEYLNWKMDDGSDIDLFERGFIPNLWVKVLCEYEFKTR